MKSEHTLQTTLYDGITLVSVLLRLGYYAETASLAGQLMAHYPQALPLHVGLGRALFATAEAGKNNSQAIGHLRRVLDSDPENWRIRLEMGLMYLKGNSLFHERAADELWMALQTAPDNIWLQDLINRLPENQPFGRIHDWQKNLALEVELIGGGRNNRKAAKHEEDVGGLGRIYLGRKMPWMAVQCFEAALERNPSQEAAWLSLKTGLLVAYWQNGEQSKACALASELLLSQPQLILPRLMLTAQLSSKALKDNIPALSHLMEPVWQVDPLLERSTELANYAGVHLQAELWPEFSAVRAGPKSGIEWWSRLGFNRPVQLRLGNLDSIWLKELMNSARQEVEDNSFAPYREVSFSLSEFDGYTAETTAPVKKGVLAKGGPLPTPPRYSADIEKVAAGIAQVEKLLYGSSRSFRPARPAQRPTYKPGRAGVTRPKGGTESHSLPLTSDHKTNAIDAGLIAASYSPNLIFNLEEDYNSGAIQQATAVVVSSEHALSSKYGTNGFMQIKTLLLELVDILKKRGYDGRLLLVDSNSALREAGFERIEAVKASVPEQIRGVINAALPNERGNPALPDSVFIIGGPDIIPFCRLPNPSFDSDREVLSDNPYGTKDSAYLLPERVVGRIPDGSEQNPAFLLQQLAGIIRRQRLELISPKVLTPLPLRMLEGLLPSRARQSIAALDNTLQFEQDWLELNMGKGEQFLDTGRAGKMPPFFYSAEAWKQSTETLRRFLFNDSPIAFSPPMQAQNFDARQLERARLLHFNLHGFQNTSNWYGQSQASRLVTSPSLSSLPLAFTPDLAAGVKSSGTVVFSEACYGSFMAGKKVNESVALTLLAGGASAVVASTVISYGSAGEELSCAGHLAYYFWRGVLTQGYTFGRALQAAKIEYARERLGAGHNLTGDDAKTLLEFVLLGDPTIGLRATSPVVDEQPLYLSGRNAGVMPKGGIFQPLRDFWEEEQTIRKNARRIWEMFTRPKAAYQPVQSQKLPRDLVAKFEKALEWLLPDSVPASEMLIHTLIDMSNASQQTFKPNRPYPKGGEHSGFSDWYEESDDQQRPPPEHYEAQEAQFLVSGQRPLFTVDGFRYQQTFHLTSDIMGKQMVINLSKGKG